MSDFSVYAATQFAEWLSQGTIDSPPSSLFIAVFDDTDTERSTDFANDRVETLAGSDWDLVNTNDFENNSQIDFGEATTDVTNLQDVAIYDAASGGNELARFEMTDALFDVSAGTQLIFGTGTISFDVLDRTE